MVGTLGTILKWVILLPVLIAVVLLAVANDHSVTVHLNPFNAEDTVLSVDLALYQVGFLLFAAGALVGGLVVWSSQRKHRRRARQGRSEAASWRARAERSEQGQGQPQPQTQTQVRPQSQAQPAPAAGFLPRPERG